MLVGLDGTALQTEAREMVEKNHVGGFILYKYNITSLLKHSVCLMN